MKEDNLIGDGGSRGCPDCRSTPTWEDNIKELFSEKDQILWLGQGIDITNYDQVKGNADKIYQSLQPNSPWPGGSRMPKGGPYWTDDCILCFARWMITGFQKKKHKHIIDYNYRIHPAIGIARVGNSEEYYLGPETAAGLPVPGEPPGSKKTGGLPIKPGTESDTITSSDIRDSAGALKRQAARFKIYQYPVQKSETYPKNLPEVDVNEITVGSKVNGKTVTDIIWTVHVANKKANSFTMVERPDVPQGIEKYENGDLPPIRNASIETPYAPQPFIGESIDILNDPDRVKKLTIDPGPRTISGISTPTVAFNKVTTASYWNGTAVQELPSYPKSFPSDSFMTIDFPSGQPIDTLGELQTDEKGRLLVLGGYGRTCTWQSENENDNTVIDHDVNNDQWFDDASDGPVTAVLVFDDGSIQAVDAGAWIVTGDPSYAPQTLNIVSLFDDIYNTWVRELELSPEIYDKKYGGYQDTFVPPFDDNLIPIFRSIELQKWNINLNSVAIEEHDKVGAITTVTAPKATKVIAYTRNPNDKGRFGGDKQMPLALGDANKDFLAVTKTQYFYLTQWAKLWQPKSDKFEYPLSGTSLGPGELLDKNVLMNCLGGRFSPGIEMTFTIRQSGIYIKDWVTSGKGPFRINPKPLDYDNLPANNDPLLTEGYIPLHNADKGIEPGDLSKLMAIPWQTDYNSCATHAAILSTKADPVPRGTILYWSWPSQRPVAVYVASDVKANGEGLPAQRWSIRGAGGSTDTSPAQNWGRYQVKLDMLTKWSDIGIIIQGSSIDTSVDGGEADADLYLEVQSKLEGSDDNPVEPFPNRYDFSPGESD